MKNVNTTKDQKSYERLPLDLCEMLEEEFVALHKRELSYKPDWLFTKNQIKDINSLVNKLNDPRSKLPVSTIKNNLEGELSEENLCDKLNDLLKKESLLHSTQELLLMPLPSWKKDELQEMSRYISGELKNSNESTRQEIFDDLIRVNRLLLEVVFPEEIESIYDWRLKKLWQEVHKLPQQQDSPSIRSALCLSGGGIRSASFALGILQGLARSKLLGKFDYLSTVSGGGYIGSWLTAWRHHYLDEIKGDPDGIKNFTEELCQECPPAKLEPAPEPIQFLRSYSNFLTPKIGLFTTDTWAFVAICLRNLLLNWFALIPLLLAILMLPRLYAATVNQMVADDITNIWILGIVGLMIIIPIIDLFINKPGAKDRYRQQHVILLSDFLPFVIAVTGLTLVIYNTWLAKQVSVPVFTVIAIPLFIIFCFILVTIFVGLQTRSVSSCGDIREWWGRAGGWMLIAALAWLVVSALVVFGPVLLTEIPGWISGIGGVAGIVAFLLGRSKRTPATNEQSLTSSLLDKILTNIAVVAAALFMVLFFVLLSLLTSWIIFKFIPYYVSLTGSSPIGDKEAHLNTLTALTPWMALFILILMGAFSLVIARLIDLNRFSLHEPYRNRLIRVFLGASRISSGKRKPDPFTGFDPEDNILMHKLIGSKDDKECIKDEQKPIPVINLALNLVHGDRLAWQERKAEPFCVTPKHSGCCFLGYRKSRDYGGLDGISLGTAATISGAAVSPNMGYSSSPILAVFLSLFNVRLGCWLGNPGIHGQRFPSWLRCKEAPFRQPAPRLSLWPLLTEAFGLTNDRRQYVYLSDGGHFDNLGLYEMVLRRCHLIIVSDAGQDPKHTFEDLANAVRKIRIDLGVEISFEEGVRIYPRTPEEKAGNVAEKTDNWAVKKGDYAAIGRIQYSVMDGKGVDDGVLIYLKPAIYGTEPRDVLQYAKAHPDFPHDSTADQFFSESQFESYRRLGCHVIDIICYTDRKEHRLSSLVERVMAHACESGKTPQWLPGWLSKL